ncbi:MAG: serine hydrolase domain-containing protein [Deltaproteobacteria bacterium]
MLTLTAVAVFYFYIPNRPAPLPSASPESVGMSEKILSRIDAEAQKSIEAGESAGAVVLVARKGKIAYQRAFGLRAVLPEAETMTLDTVFDIASLTKVIAAAASVMLLRERDAISLDDRIAKYIPEFAENGKGGITIRQILTHTSGLPEGDDLESYKRGRAAALGQIYSLKPEFPPGERFNYSGIGYIVLGEMVKNITGRSLDEFAKGEIFAPLGMRDTEFVPSRRLRKRAAPTTMRDGKWLRGRAQDIRAHYLGGVAGHAGVFSTAGDLAIFCQMILNGGIYEGARILKPETVALMTEAHKPEAGFALRGLGWDMLSPYSRPKGKLYSLESFGHTGFSGVSFWIDPPSESFIILLTNRTHPDGKANINGIRERVATIAALAVREEFGGE